MHCRCPHCHNPIEIVDDNFLADIECPSCGSSFHLISGESSNNTLPYTSTTLGHFELLQQVGVGAFGAVWKARDIDLDRIVALKIPRTESLSVSQQEQFFKEARAAAQVKHANIVSTHEVGRTGDKIYIASDFIEGANLSEWIAGKKLTVREAARLLVIVADALHAAHEAGVIHRDLKPANIMMDHEGTPYIADFGLAKRNAGEVTITVDGQILGTPAYMPPEQAKGDGHNADRRSDIYSLGVVLYQLLTGELPFRGEVRMLIVQILRDDPTPLRKLSSRVPRDLETICLKCLSKEPDRRYSTAKELSQDLSRYLAGEAIRARTSGRMERTWKWVKRNRIQTAIWAATLLAVVSISLGSLSIYAFRLANANRELAMGEKYAKGVAENAAEAEKLAKERAEANAAQAVHAQYNAHESELRAHKAQAAVVRIKNEAQEQRSLAEAVLAKLSAEKDTYEAVAQFAFEFLEKEFGADHDVVKTIRSRLQEYSGNASALDKQQINQQAPSRP